MIPETQNKAFIAAYWRGYNSPTDARCPYGDYRTAGNGVTFSRAFMHYWEDGREDRKVNDIKGERDVIT